MVENVIDGLVVGFGIFNGISVRGVDADVFSAKNDRTISFAELLIVQEPVLFAQNHLAVNGRFETRGTVADGAHLVGKERQRISDGF